MPKSDAQHSPYHVIGDALALLGSVVRLGTTLVSNKIESSTVTANAYVHRKVNAEEIESKLSEAAAGLDRASNYALHTDVRQMVDDVALFARKHPVASLGAGIALGALVAMLAQPRDHSASSASSRGAAVKARPKRGKLTTPKKISAKANGAAKTDVKTARA